MIQQRTWLSICFLFSLPHNALPLLMLNYCTSVRIPKVNTDVASVCGIFEKITVLSPLHLHQSGSFSLFPVLPCVFPASPLRSSLHPPISQPPDILLSGSVHWIPHRYPCRHQSVQSHPEFQSHPNASSRKSVYRRILNVLFRVPVQSATPLYPEDNASPEVFCLQGYPDNFLRVYPV